MKKGILNRSLKGFIAFLFLCNGTLIAQTDSFHFTKDGKLKGQDFEEVNAYWREGGKALRTKLGLNTADFRQFITFYSNRIDSDRNTFIAKITSGAITKKNMFEYIAFKESQYIFYYKQYQEAKKNFPSSVAEYSVKHNYNKRPEGTCNPSCTNIDFENGTLSGWNAYYASNSSSTTSFIITTPVGGAAGAVTKAAFDPSAAINDYQVEIMSGGFDALAPSVPTVSPFGGKYSARIGDSTVPYQGVAILNQTFQVTAANTNFTYMYAVFLENPGHPYYEQPFFNIALLDAVGDTIPHCGTYNVVSGAGLPGYDSVFYSNDGDYVYYKNWTVVFASLKAYIGQCVTIQFQASDCALGGHFGYAYVDASCSPVGLISSSPALCGQKFITLTAPSGGISYSWTGPAGGIVGASNTQSVNVDSAGTYTVIVTPVTGTFCADTVSITVPKAPGPPPIPSFKADTVCMGTPTQFTNTSTPDTAGDKFYWIFNGLSTYQDSTTNPSYTFSSPGVYSVKLFEVSGGCGADTTILVKVDSNSVSGFTYTNACVGQTVFFTNTSTGATIYSWNFGDPGSGPANTSTILDPTHIYGSAGTYTVTLVSSSGGSCSDTLKEAVTITSPPVVTVSGTDSICPGASDVLTASGATSYIWQPGGLSGATVTVTPSATTTYTVTGTTGLCSHDSTFTVVVKVNPTAGITAKPDTICVGDSAHLYASGGGTYLWSSPSSTSDSIWVKPGSTTNYNLLVTKDGCSVGVNKTVTVQSAASIILTLSKDSICPNDSATLTVTGANTYVWSTGATTSSITVSPGVTTPYWVVAQNLCAKDSLAKTLHIVPFPTPLVSGNDSICTGSSTTLTATGGTTYTWNPGSLSGAVVTVKPVSTTTYTLEAANGACSKDTTFTVYVSPYPTPLITAVPDSVCPGGSSVLTASGGGTYSWATGQTSDTLTVAPVTTSVYTVTVTKNGCSISTTGQVNVIVPGSTTLVLSRDSICPSDTASFKAAGATTYSWSPAAGLSCTNCPNPEFTGTVTAGNYTYTLIAHTKCAIDTLKKTITVVGTPTVTIVGNDSVCAGTNTVLTASGGSSYKWSTGSTKASIIVSPSVNTTYYVTVSNGHCSTIDSFRVRIKPLPIVTITGPTTACSGDNVTITATGGGTYEWSTGQSSSSITVPATAALSNLYVVVTKGCADTVKYPISVVATKGVVAWAHPDTVPLGTVVNINASGVTGYVWSPSSQVNCYTCPNTTTAGLTNNTTFTVTGTDSNGCVSTAEVTIYIECEDFFVPNVFTPNGDGDNDEFIVRQVITKTPLTLTSNPEEPDYTIEIFDRWGKKVFSANGSTAAPWNGKIDNTGGDAPTGVYYYIIKSTCDNNNYDQHGFVQLIR